MRKVCERCFEEYDDEEFTKITEFGDRIICIPCAHIFEMEYRDFLINFLLNHSHKETVSTT